MGLAAHKLPIPTKFVTRAEGIVIMPRRIERFANPAATSCNCRTRELTEQIFRLRFQLTTGQAEALKRLREARKDLARVKTFCAPSRSPARASSRSEVGSCRWTAAQETKATRETECTHEKTTAARISAAKNQAARHERQVLTGGNHREDGKDHRRRSVAPRAASQVLAAWCVSRKSFTRMMKSARPSPVTPCASFHAPVVEAQALAPQGSAEAERIGGIRTRGAHQ